MVTKDNGKEDALAIGCVAGVVIFVLMLLWWLR